MNKKIEIRKFIHPPLKWAGGKYKSLQYIIPTIEEYGGKRYIEDFVGSGTVFLNVNGFKEYIIADTNNDLISFFSFLRNSSDEYIKESKKLFLRKNNNREIYEDIRQKFNDSSSPEERAILFLYLNKHCFNGLCRYNKDGKFNVPFGTYTEINFPENALNIMAEKLQKVKIINSDFRDTLKQYNKKDDFHYDDPPYSPLNKTSSFTSYTHNGFDEQDHRDLALLAEKNRGTVLISNNKTKLTKSLYSSANKIIEFDIRRTINSKSKKRILTKEILVIYEAEL